MTTEVTWKAKLALILFGITLSLVVLEVGLRLFFPPARGTEFADLNEVRKAMLDQTALAPESNAAQGEPGSANLRGLVAPHPNDNIIYDLIPNLDITFQRAPVHINSCGMRSPERPVRKPENTYRIALLGDSFAFGWGVRQEETFAQVLEDKLNALSEGRPNFEVLNFGIPGYSTFQEVSKFEESGLIFQPDAVLVFFIENDFGLPFYVRDIYNPGSMLSSVSFARLTWKAIDPKIEEQNLKLTAYDPNKALKRLSDICRERGIRLLLAINPKRDWRQHKKKLWVLNERPDIGLVNMRQDLLRVIDEYNIPEKALTLSFDPHPSPLRHSLYGYLLAPSFMDVIK